jgi:hypothetical protein
VIRAGNILMEQVAMQAKERVANPHSPLKLLPSALVERRPSVPPKPDKAKYSDHVFEEETDDLEEQGDIHNKGEDNASIVAHSTLGYRHHQPHAATLGKDLPTIRVPAPTYGNLVPPLLPSPQEQSHATDMLSATSATSTLASIGRSLQWTQKFPQGRHLSRAKSRTTLRGQDASISSSNNKLAEARAGLRLLAKRREDIAEEEEWEPSRAGKWTGFKWILFSSVLLVFLYGTLGSIFTLLTWAEAWEGAEVSDIVDTDIVIRKCVARIDQKRRGGMCDNSS